jgi:hypothetical protein
MNFLKKDSLFCSLSCSMVIVSPPLRDDHQSDESKVSFPLLSFLSTNHVMGSGLLEEPDTE